VVEATCREYGLPYRTNRTFGAGLASHYRWLRLMGRPDPVPVPLVLKPAPQT
jgi:linoleoyl-CoA desaturase